MNRRPHESWRFVRSQWVHMPEVIRHFVGWLQLDHYLRNLFTAEQLGCVLSELSKVTRCNVCMTSRSVA